MRHRASFRILTAALFATVPASAGAQRYVAPTDRTVFSSTEERQGEPPVHLIFVENRSTVPITVFSYTLSGCENVRPRCTTRGVSIKIHGGRRELVARVEPDQRHRGFSYRFRFSWRADSAGVNALAALAAGGERGAQERLANIRRADSVARSESGARYRELTRDDYTALAGRAVQLRADPDSLVLMPGERTTIERIQLVLVDSQGVPFGRTRWVRWGVPGSGAVQFVPPDQIIAHGPGRVVFRFAMADDAQAALQRRIPEIEVPVVVAYPHDPRAPVFSGVAVDADSKAPLACARVALEDSAQNVVARGRTARDGSFVLNAPRPGTYRVRTEAFGWMPSYGPPETAGPDETKQYQYAVRFTEQMLMPRRPMRDDEFEHAYPAAVSTAPIGAARQAGAAPVIPAVTLGGSESMPILGIIGGAPAGTTWMTFVVDSIGRVDPASVLLPPEASKAALSSVRSVLPRVRFSPARERGKPTCELLKMQVNFSPR